MSEPRLQDRIGAAAASIRARTPIVPRLGVILGSGLGAFAADVDGAVTIPYDEIPFWPVSTAPGHAGRLTIGRMEGVPLAVMAGRAHLYEGYSVLDVSFPVRVLRALGVETLIITNAAGGLNPDYEPGSLMVIADHINLTGRNPLIGPNDAALGPRFPDMTHAYDPALRSLAFGVGREIDVPLREGVYLGLVGPNYETPAEIRAFRLLGADAVGMSTVMESIAANHAGMRVLGISCVTNMAAGLSGEKLTEQEVIDTAAAVSRQFRSLLGGLVRVLGEEKQG